LIFFFILYLYALFSDYQFIPVFLIIPLFKSCVNNEKLMRRPSNLQKEAVFPAIGARLMAKRKALCFTQTQIAELIDVEPETISRIESGSVAPSIERLAMYAQTLGLGLEELFSDIPITPYDTQKEWLALMADLSPADRTFVLSMVRTWVQRLK
jgi:transcriptional regulator with XRE-family HTH domain